jgi:hypothetical protein
MEGCTIGERGSSKTGGKKSLLTINKKLISNDSGFLGVFIVV